jgi:maltoporin
VHAFLGRVARAALAAAAVSTAAVTASAQASPPADEPKPAAEPKQEPAKAEPAKAEPKAEAPPPAPEPPRPATGFSFGSYGRMIAATDFKGRPGRDADIVAHGSRLDEGNYVELELRRDDYFPITKTATRLVATLAVGTPLFHYTGNFDVKMGVRNLYLEARNLGGTDLSVWAGSRMYRGDDIYLLDWWPLDNLNTVGGGARYDFTPNTYLAAHFGLNQPASAFFYQDTKRAAPLDQFGTSTVTILNRQKMIGSLKLSHIIRIGETGGVKGVLYSEIHQLPQGQRETKPEVFETLPGDLGWVIGAQVGAFTGKRDTHLNLFFRYARGLAAYGEFATPADLNTDKTAAGAHELVLALGGNYEVGPFGLMLGAYVRSFRNASAALDYHDVDEGIFAIRPHFFFGELGGVALEASYQIAQRGVLPPDGTNGMPGSGPLTAKMARFGIIPFLSLAGRGDYSRPQLRLIYMVTPWNDGLRSLYPQDDVFSLPTHSVEHFFGFGAEWWFNSSSYGG